MLAFLTVLFCTAIITGTTAIYAATPLIFELACEISYPTGEGTANGMLTLLNNLCGGVFLLIMLDPNIGRVQNAAVHFVTEMLIYLAGW